MPRLSALIARLLIPALCLLPAGLAGAQQTEDAIIARVNGEAIMLSQLKEAALDQDVPLSDLLASGMRGGGYRRAITQLVDEELLLEKAQSEEIKVSDMEIASRVDKMIGAFKAQLGTPEQFADFLKRSHLTLDQMRALMTDHERRGTLTTEVVAKRVRLDGDTVARFARERRSRHEPVEQVNLAQILIECSPRELAAPLGEALRRKALAAAREAGSEPGRFANFARQYARGEGGRAQGGYLGWLDPESLLAPLRDQVRTMAPGDVSAPIPSDQGLHVLMLIGRRSARDLCFVAEFARQRERLIEQLRRDASIQLFDLNGKPLSEPLTRSAESPTTATQKTQGPSLFN